MTSHFLLDKRIRIYQRERSAVWQCATRLEGKEWRASTKAKSLAAAKDFAENWYFDLRGRSQAFGLQAAKTFADAAKVYLDEARVITAGERNPRFATEHEGRLRNYLLPFFGDTAAKDITTSMVQAYRVQRLTVAEGDKPPARGTLHHEIVTLRQTLKTALRHGWIDHLPDFSEPYQRNRKVSHRAWFSPEEYKQLYTATRERTKRATGAPWKWAAEQLHDYVLFMANTGLRPDEAKRLQYRDVSIEEDDGERILVIEVRGKRGTGYCKSTTGAVHPFERLQARNRPCPADLVFKADHKKQFKRILEDAGLKFDREGSRRSSYSLRHTYICLRLLEGADIYQIAKNCRTSVEMIEKHYAVHLKNTLDARAINVRR